MAFDIIAWALGWGAAKLADGLVKALTPSDLAVRLQATVESWANALPAGYEIDPGAVFRLNDPDAGDARKLLSKRITDGQLPTKDEWFAALMERWTAVDRANGLQPFFNQPATEASRHLQELAERLSAVCRGDERMFRSAVLRYEEWKHVGRNLSRNEPVQKHAVLFVSDVIEPRNYNRDYVVDFHIHNPTEAELLIGRLRIEIKDIRKINQHRVVTPGALAARSSFTAYLTPNDALVPLVPLNSAAREFRLSPNGGTDLFSLTVSGVPGYEYSIKLAANETRLADNGRSSITTPELSLSFGEG